MLEITNAINCNETNNVSKQVLHDHLRPITRKQARKREEVLIGKIKAAFAAGKFRTARKHTRTYFKSYAAKLTAVERAWREVKPHRKPSRAVLRQIAENLDPFAGTDEPVILHLKEKAGKNGAYRPIMDFGIENRALQIMVLRVLSAQARLHPFQFGSKGGTHAAIRAVKKALLDGRGWTVQIDLKDCFLSFDGEELPDLLPIPKEVTERVILSRHLTLVPGNPKSWVGPDDGPDVEFFYSEIIADARPGIPQGSASSPLVAEMLLAPVFAHIPEHSLVCNFADNFLCMARDEKDVVETTKALGSAFKAHPAGHLRPTLVEHSEPGESFKFLGHAFQVVGPEVRVNPSAKNRLDFDNTLGIGLSFVTNKSNSQHKRTKKLRELREYVRSWTAAFSECDSIYKIRNRALRRLDKAELDVL